jgi:hypothetical protein
MADFTDPPQGERLKAWEEWLASRPDAVRAVLERIKPWKLYRLKTTGHRVVVSCVDEEVGGGISLKVIVSGQFNVVAFERTVFGIDPDDLEECDLPAPGEPLGSADLTIEEARELMKKRDE